eukprot:9488178-Pyramimonas_sp.AAC.1
MPVWVQARARTAGSDSCPSCQSGPDGRSVRLRQGLGGALHLCRSCENTPIIHLLLYDQGLTLVQHCLVDSLPCLSAAEG